MMKRSLSIDSYLQNQKITKEIKLDNINEDKNSNKTILKLLLYYLVIFKTDLDDKNSNIAGTDNSCHHLKTKDMKLSTTCSVVRSESKEVLDTIEEQKDELFKNSSDDSSVFRALISLKGILF